VIFLKTLYNKISFIYYKKTIYLKLEEIIVKPVDAHLEELWSDDVRVVPKAAFASEELYQLELERIFLGPIWHALAHIAEIPNPGDFKSTYLGETPILLVHQKDGQIKAFYNACTHRGTLLETRACGHAEFLNVLITAGYSITMVHWQKHQGVKLFHEVFRKKISP